MAKDHGGGDGELWKFKRHASLLEKLAVLAAVGDLSFLIDVVLL
jgi:hypothetical protein